MAMAPRHVTQIGAISCSPCSRPSRLVCATDASHGRRPRSRAYPTRRRCARRRWPTWSTKRLFIAGSIAAAKGLPFAALRVVSDAADFELPPAALARLTSAGAVDFGTVLASIIGDLGQIPELIQLGENSEIALDNLRLALARVGNDFAV